MGNTFLDAPYLAIGGIDTAESPRHMKKCPKTTENLQQPPKLFQKAQNTAKTSKTQFVVYKPPPLYLEDAARLLNPGGRAVLLSGDVPPLFPGWDVKETHTYPLGPQSRVRTLLVRA